MSQYGDTIGAVVRQGVRLGLSADELNTPLIEQLAVVTVGTAKATGAKIDDLVEIVRHQLDQRVAHHVHHSTSG